MTAKFTPPDSARRAAASPPWWRFGMVWFVLSGPALVVVAGVATMVVAFTNADVELHVPTPVSALSIRIGAQTRLIGRSSATAGADPVRQRPAAAAH